MRIHEVLDILTVSQLVLHASLARKSSSAPLFFRRSDYPEMDPQQDRHHIVIRQENGTDYWKCLSAVRLHFSVRYNPANRHLCSDKWMHNCGNMYEHIRYDHAVLPE